VEFWQAITAAAEVLPGFWQRLATAEGEAARDVYQAALLAREVRARGIEHLHAHFATSATSVARMAAELAGITYSFTAHAKDIYHEDVSPQSLRRKLADAAAVVTVSDYNLRFLHENFDGAAEHAHRIYNGLDLPRLPFRSPRERAPLVLGVGRLVEKKGFDDLIAACDILRRRGRTFTCKIIGEGEVEAALREQMARLNLASHVQLTGPQPQAEVFEAIAASAAFVAPCVVGSDGNRDGLPTVLLEAMALGAPCVSTDVTGIPEIVRHNETGLMVPQHDPGAIADAIDRLLSDAALRVRLAGEARRLVETQFDTTANTAAIRELFAAAVAHPSRARVRQECV
jgi:glycosyltransferase involved in cell wall biosynthesis